MKKDNRNSVVAFGAQGWFHIIYMLLMFWFYVGMINDGSNNIAGNIAQNMLGSAKMAGTEFRLSFFIFDFPPYSKPVKLHPHLSQPLKDICCFKLYGYYTENKNEKY